MKEVIKILNTKVIIGVKKIKILSRVIPYSNYHNSGRSLTGGTLLTGGDALSVGFSFRGGCFLGRLFFPGGCFLGRLFSPGGCCLGRLFSPGGGCFLDRFFLPGGCFLSRFFLPGGCFLVSRFFLPGRILSGFSGGIPSGSAFLFGGDAF